MFDGGPFPMFQHQPDPNPSVPWAAPTDFKMLCDYCNQEIKIGDESISFLLGILGVGKRNHSPMVMPISENREEATIHHECLSAMIVDEMPWIADEILQCMDSMKGDHDVDEPHECLCANCEAKIEND